MSEIFELMQHANNVAQTAKDAMASQSLAADKTTDGLTRTILEEAKRLLPRNKVLAAISLPTSGDLPWTSVRSAMEAVSDALSEENSRGGISQSIRRTGVWG